MSTFVEQLDQYGYNRRLAARTAVQLAVMADGADGLVIRHGKSLIVLRADEARNLMGDMQSVLAHDEQFQSRQSCQSRGVSETW